MFGRITELVRLRTMRALRAFDARVARFVANGRSAAALAGAGLAAARARTAVEAGFAANPVAVAFAPTVSTALRAVPSAIACGRSTPTPVGWSRGIGGGAAEHQDCTTDEGRARAQT
jgi:hypothetical protein